MNKESSDLGSCALKDILRGSPSLRGATSYSGTMRKLRKRGWWGWIAAHHAPVNAPCVGVSRCGPPAAVVGGWGWGGVISVRCFVGTVN